MRVLALIVLLALQTQAQVTLNQKDTGYRGVWYYNQLSGDEYVYKYSGGLGTYCAKHKPFAVYRPEVNKTFFCYGGTSTDAVDELWHMVSYYDHETGTVPRPTILLDKGTDDAHDNPVITVDDSGYVWIFSTSHGTSRPSYIHKSTEPYAVDSFVQVNATYLDGGTPTALDNFSYFQIWNVPGNGFIAFFTKYGDPVTRTICCMTSPDGVTWSEWQRLSILHQGSYQVSAFRNGKTGSAFNYHPDGLGLNYRTNLYYVETPDLGTTWTTAAGETLSLPLGTVSSIALVHDYEAEGLNVYMKDIRYDANGRPVIMYVTSKGYESGPANDPRTWRTARWTGSAWDIRDVTTSDNNYDMGSLYLDADGTWRIVAPTETGPQPYNPGGEMAAWTSSDSGRTWEKDKQLTVGSVRNHTYAREPLNAADGFTALWADGHGRQPSESHLYFCNREGTVFELPAEMTGDTAVPDTLRPPVSLGYALQPDTLRLLQNEESAVRAYELFADGTELALVSAFTWTVADTNVVAVSDDGLVRAVAATGTTSVMCSSAVRGIALSAPVYVGAPGPGVLFDDFEQGGRLNWLPGTASRWEITGDDGDSAYHLNTSDFDADGVKPGEYALLDEGSFGSFIFEGAVKSDEDGTNSAPDWVLVFGYTGPDDFYYLIGNGKASASNIFKIAAGDRTVVDSLNISLVTGGYDHIRLEVTADSLVLAFNGTEITRLAETVPEGMIGIGGFNDASFWDNVKITDTGLQSAVTDRRDVDAVIPVSGGTGCGLYDLNGAAVADPAPGVYLEVRNGVVGKRIILDGRRPR